MGVAIGIGWQAQFPYDKTNQFEPLQHTINYIHKMLAWLDFWKDKLLSSLIAQRSYNWKDNSGEDNRYASG